MKKTVTLILFFIVNFSFAQNLVPNWSFEDTVACPVGIGCIFDAVGWSSYSQTPDYFNQCNTSTNGTDYAGVPGNYLGYHFAKTGVAYAGFYAFTTAARNIREIIGIQLNQTLIKGEKYFVSFFVSRAYHPSQLYINVGTNKIGARFSTVQYYDSTFKSNRVPIDNHAQVFTDSVITDTLNWIKISGSFIADSAYQYVSFGNFFTDSATTHVAYDSSAEYAYYYIDDIYVSTDSLIGIKESKENFLIDIFPNPTTNVVHIVNNSNSSINLTIYSSLGMRVFKDYIKEGDTDIDISNYSKGVYFLQIEQKGGIVQKRIIRY